MPTPRAGSSPLPAPLLLVLLPLVFIQLLSSASCGHRLPIITLTANTPRELGHAVGTARRESLRSFFLAPDSALNKTLRPFYETESGRQYIDGLVAASERLVPDQVEELRGIAAAIGLPFIEVFLQNCESEIGLLVKRPTKLGDHCTDVLTSGSTPSERWIAHNEDYSPDTIGHVFLLNATIASTKESFVGFIYPGTMAGWAFSFNGHGLAVTANAVFPKQVTPGAIPVTLACRRILRATTIDEALSLIDSLPTSGGIALNIAQTGPDHRVVSAELAPRGPSSKFLASELDFLVHVNQYSHNPMRTMETSDASSVARLQRAHQLLSQDSSLPFSPQGIMQILGDTKDPNYPIYRSGNDDDIYTLATGLFDLGQGELSIWLANPKLSEPAIRLLIPNFQVHVPLAIE